MSAANDPWNVRSAILHGHWTFLNRSFRCGFPPDWHVTELPLLWRFNLHYFNYLYLLEPDEQTQICEDWIERNPPRQSPAWHPYPTSLRLVNWIRSGLQSTAQLGSAYEQASYLARALETHVGGNHLIENLRALMLAAEVFCEQGEAAWWREKAIHLFRSETREQVLADGMHYERSPMYHALMLDAYMDILSTFKESESDWSWLQEVVCRMVDALASFLRPDGTIALFNDSTTEIAPPPGRLLDRARRATGHRGTPRQSLDAAGYYFCRHPRADLAIDAGPGGPPHLMAHAHADVFSYELAIDGVSLVTDTGVYEYEPGEMRDYCRSTAAHNTLTIDGRDQFECWSSFRVARRTAPRAVSVHIDNRFWRFSGELPTYRGWPGGPFSHGREVLVDLTTGEVHVRDSVEGHGSAVIESRVHLHPEANLQQMGTELLLKRQDACCRFVPDSAELRVETGWYCPRFGCRQRRQVIVLGGRRQLPTRMGYRLIP